MQFTSAHLDTILTANWPVAARLVAWARALVGLAADTLPKHTILEARRILRPAESFIRRLIVIMACRVELPDAPPFRTTRTGAADPGPSRPGAQTQGHLGCAEPIAFSTEPFPKITPFTYPGIWSPGAVRYTPPSPEELAAAPVPAAHFFARLARLEAALAAPEAAALRLARWLARRRAAGKQRVKSVRTMPIRPWGLMPGRGSDMLDALTKDRLKYTACAAQAALCEGAWNTS
ncbi:hypothetical protein [Hyphomonas sp.]|uniref:hypothetical protein n=1 Tax=Hyphomonas sp. TaxID=87 RepID=UPI0039188456